ncbi:MAG: ATP-dependent helicase [Oscillospiraceae bacterium]|jgi:DNA helicase-2/ATP-dependent DNA helicase PcrA
MTEEEKRRFIKARREVIEAEFSGLNPMQRMAVMKTEGPLLLLAGAGSGKTTVLINRIANIIKYGRGSDSEEVPAFIGDDELRIVEEYAAARDPVLKDRAQALCAVDPAPPWSIIAITFTNKAANELKSRLSAMLGPEAEDVWASTFHSACARILRRDIDRLGFDRSFTVYDTDDSRRVMKDVVSALNLDDKVYAPKAVLSVISKAKDARQTPDDVINDAEKRGDRRMACIGRCYAEYQRRLREYNALDFDDMISHTVTLLEEFADVREYYQRKFRYVLVDEYQDTNNLQYLLTRLLAGGYRNICVVGDDDQSIYRFRGATIENILSFEDEYKDAAVIKLEQNYRSTKHILTAANAVIKNNEGRKGKQLWTDNPEGSRISLYTAMNENEEAQYVATQILRGYAKTRRWSDFAVLYRINAQSNQLEYAFKRSGIPYRIVGGTRFYDRAEVKDMLAYLCLINNRADDVRLKRIINNPARNIGDVTLNLAERIAAEQGKPIFSVVSEAKNYPELARAAARLGEFAKLIDSLDDAKGEMPLPEFYDLVAEKTGYLRMLESKDDIESRTRSENVRELRSSIVAYCENETDGSLAGFLDEVALYSDIDNYDAGADAAVMMTIHSAKGLEFPSVFIVGMEDGIFPGLRSIGSAEDMEEERRLCYVAITRAKNELTLTCASQRMLFGRTASNRPSRFIEEIPAEQLDRSGQVLYTGRPAPSTARRFEERTEKRPKQLKPLSPAPAQEFKKGEIVEHTAFGRGMVISVQKMGNDALLEVAFDSVGTKRLMANTAGRHMKRI